jgi:hypothetical protein
MGLTSLDVKGYFKAMASTAPASGSATSADPADLLKEAALRLLAEQGSDGVDILRVISSGLTT